MPYVSKPSFQKMLAKCLNIAVLSQLLTSLVAQMVKCLHTMQETHVQSLGWEDLLEKEMATHSSITVWRIPGMEEPGRVQSMGSPKTDHLSCLTYLVLIIIITHVAYYLRSRETASSD